MTADVEPDDWTSIDTWCDTVTTSIVVRPDSARLAYPDHFQDCWERIDEWHAALAGTSPVACDGISNEALGQIQLTESWKHIDSWWREYIETSHDTTERIADVLAQLNTAWETGGGPFDSDPLAADVTGKYVERGPLRPTGEVAWSRWLARLLQPSQVLVTELFDVPVEEPPQEVIREDRLEKEDDEEVSHRRPDILVRYSDRGISIEVKLDDPHYSKTADTAQLVEQQYDGEWTHTLLLPKRHASRLDATVEPNLTSQPDGRQQIEWDEPGPITVLYWQDVTATLRTLLRRGDIVDDHWAANAYLFCALAEQQLLGFRNQEEINQMAEPTDVVDTVQPIALADTLEKQLTYLSERVET